MIKSNQLTDNLDKIRDRVDNIISKSKIISKKEKINQAYIKMSSELVKIFKRLMISSWFTLTTKKLNLIRESFNNFEDMNST